MYKKIILFLLSFLILKCLYVGANYTVYYDGCKNTKNYIDITENMSDNDSVLINIPPGTSYNEMPDEIIFEYDLVTPYGMESYFSSWSWAPKYSMLYNSSFPGGNFGLCLDHSGIGSDYGPKCEQAFETIGTHKFVFKKDLYPLNGGMGMELRYSFQGYYLNGNKVDTPDMSNFYNVTFEGGYWNYNMSEDENKEIYRGFGQINIKPYPQNYFGGNAIPIYGKISKVRAYMMGGIGDKCGNVIIQTPSNLKQYVQSPGLEEEPINPGEKIGKYQSGTGIILKAYVDNNTGKQVRLAVEVYKYGTTTPLEMFNSGYFDTGTGDIIIPYLGSGSYYWRIRTEDNLGNASDWASFGTDNLFEIDYSLYEGFEPYPFGYSFANSSPAEYSYLFTNAQECWNSWVHGDVLNGGIAYTSLSPLTPYIVFREKVPGNRWDIFESAFDISNFNNNEIKLLDSFESFALNETIGFQAGNCYGMAVSSAMQKTYPEFMQTYYSEFSSKIGTGDIWHNIDKLSMDYNNYWNEYNNTLKTILAFQLSQFDKNQYKLKLTYTGALNAYDTLLKNPSKTYVLNFWGTVPGLIYGENPVGHSVIPYKVETTAEGLKRIYFRDNNVQFPKRKDDIAYNQYIEITSTGYWNAPHYKDRNSFTDLSLVSLDDIYNGGNKSTPIGFNNIDLLFTLNGTSDLLITDSQGRISGFSGGTILEEIPGVDVIVPLNDTLSGTIENIWKQIYLPQKQDLTVKVIAKGQERYDLMVAGGDYYTKLSDIQTSTGQIDIFESKVDNLKIDFDDTKTGSYNLLTDNFQENNTGTIYIDSVPVITTKQEYNIDWTKVQTNEIDSVIQNIDTNNDGVYDEQINLPPVFQDLLSPTTTVSFSGILTPNQTGSYIESTTITLTATDNEGGVGVDTIYYSLDNTGIIDKVYLPYTEPIIVNGVNNYTLTYYSVDKFGNKEQEKTANFTLTEKPETYQGEISGYVYKDINSNGIKDSLEKTMAGWKICIDQNNNNDCEESIEPFILTNNNGYYEFNGLVTGTYKILEIPHQNWILTYPTSKYYTIQLLNGQKVTNKNFGNLKTKGK